MATEPRLAYADSSALVKLIVDEPESTALDAYLAETPTMLATSRIALVEVVRAARVANPAAELEQQARALVESCVLVDPAPPLLERAASLATRRVRALDAIHLASAEHVEPDEMLVYDVRMATAAAEAGFAVVAPR